MALHVIPVENLEHTAAYDCPCGPVFSEAPHRGATRRAYIHRDQTAEQRQEGPNHAATGP